MRRLAFSAAFVGFAVLGARLVMPRPHARMLAACRNMFEEMPEDFPPRRMLAGIQEIRLNSARALMLLEEQAGEGKNVHAGSSTARAAAQDVGKEEHLASVGASTSGYVLAPDA